VANAFPCSSDCLERRPGCHGSCSKYLVAKDVWDARQGIIRKQKEKEIQTDRFFAAAGLRFKTGGRLNH
jgi:hypothetical protein